MQCSFMIHKPKAYFQNWIGTTVMRQDYTSLQVPPAENMTINYQGRNQAAKNDTLPA